MIIDIIRYYITPRVDPFVDSDQSWNHKYEFAEPLIGIKVSLRKEAGQVNIGYKVIYGINHSSIEELC